MQETLFKLEQDNRVQELRRWIHLQLISDRFWHPSAKYVLEIASSFGVNGSLPLDIYEEVRDNMAKDEEEYEDEYDDEYDEF